MNCPFRTVSSISLYLKKVIMQTCLLSEQDEFSFEFGLWQSLFVEE